jgi:hypothetical protein
MYVWRRTTRTRCMHACRPACVCVRSTSDTAVLVALAIGSEVAVADGSGFAYTWDDVFGEEVLV